MRLLLVEDNQRLSELICDTLRQAGYAVDVIETVEEFREAIPVVTYDLVLLDLGLPDGDGMDLLQEFRAEGHATPVMVITARTALGERVKGLDNGADDYLVKPFHVDELLARCRAILRRPGGNRSVALTLGSLVLDPSAHQVTLNGEQLTFPPKELALLTVLMRRAGQVVAKEFLEENLTEFGKEVTPNAVEAIISRARKRLNDAGADVEIKTVRGIGYFLAEKTVEAG